MKNPQHSLRTLLNTAIRRVHPFVLIVWCAGVLAAYLMGMYVTGPFHAASRWMGAMLACTSVVVVLQRSGYRESLPIGLTRVLGTFIGALVAYIYLVLFPFTVVGMLGTVFVLEMVFMLLNIYQNGYIATMTLLIIMLISQMEPNVNPAVNCMLRFFESAVGVGVGVLLLWLIDRWNRWRTHLGRSSDGSPADMDTMPLRWGHLQVLLVASMGQLTGAALSTLVGVVLPLLQLARHADLPALAQGAIAATPLIGITAGSLLFGRLSDRRGYLLFFRLCPLIVLAGSLVGVLAGHPAGLAASLFLMGLGIGGGYSLDSDYISEIMPRRWRLTMVGIAKAFSAPGSILMAVACYFLLHEWHDPQQWNRLLLLVSLLAVVMLVTRIRFTQSPGWLYAHGRDDEAERAIRYFLGSDVTIGEIRNRPHRTAAPPADPGPLFRGENLRRVIFTGIPWACEGMAVYGIGVFLPLLVLSIGLHRPVGDAFARIVGSVETTAWINLAILPGFILGLLAVRRLSHIRMQYWGFLLCAAGLGLLLAAHLLHWHAWIALAGFMLFELFLNAGPHLITFILPAQVYPVADRGAGTGMAAAFGKAGAVLGVLFVPVLLKWGGMTLVLSIVIAVQLIGAAVTARFGRKVMPTAPPDKRKMPKQAS